MLYQYFTTAKGSLVGVWKIEELPQDLLQLVPQYEKEFTLHIAQTVQKRQKEWLAVRCLLQAMLGNSTAPIVYENRQPFLADGSYHLSISHTTNYAALIIHVTCKVGIDIETILPRARRIKQKFLSDKELLAIENTPVNKPEKEAIIGSNFIFSLCWSAKEAVYKWYSKGDLQFNRDMIIESHSLTTALKQQKQGQLLMSFYKYKKAPLLSIHYQTIANSVLCYVEKDV